MAEQPTRPFYGEYAWAFDLLIDRPVGQECATIAACFSERGVLPGATLLDAGYGTGPYAGELARRGYAVEGVDRSSELIDRQAVRPRSRQFRLISRRRPPRSTCCAVRRHSLPRRSQRLRE